ncbi:phosphoglycolate phosphatase [Nitrospirillum sp. BR 11828]|uniref:phosphoglycolate phosphatase n=1 Tax=Nitrospirillum sp. BR 11828 TaxID=3104325 RepID=UPI002ACA24CB|nr:phosphoglycolate phosphatase [Nitrospirillum sp. BR 11828]MDZ5648555.1 phosphoglycolate phosphatase [Nitrospirillum sp. BR 11828]
MSPMPAAVLFDFDGTLIDSAPDILTGINRLLDEENLPNLDLAQVHQFIGDGAPMLVTRTFAAVGRPLDPDSVPAMTDRYMAIYESLPADPACVFPGVAATLASLSKSMPLALVTNKPERATHAVLGAIGLDGLFTAVVGGDTLPTRKPHPGPLLHAMAQMGVAATETVMVGDGANDVTAGRAAGCRVVCVTYGYPRMPVEELGADRLVDHFHDLPAALADLALR